ncbi:MAG: YfhO family protein [Chloroflexi bacterium]|nr:YfhO family protein [Chloroflexota bacterium]
MMNQSKGENRKQRPEQSEGSEIINDLAALALLTALVLLFFWRIITPRLEDRAVFPPGDFTEQFWAFRVYAARAFAEGHLPLWSENFNSGHPFLADVQSALFYPISLIWTLIVVAVRGANFTLLDLEIEAIVHFVLAGAFTYLFARRVIGSRVAALVSALTFTFGGYLTSYPPQQLAILETATWLPLALLFLDLAVESSVIASEAKQSPNHLGIASARYYVAAGVTLGIAALAGHPQTFMFVGYACVIYFVWRIANCELRIANARRKFYVLPFAFSLLIAIGISAAQWLPTLEYQLISTRATMTWAEAARGFPTLDPLQMILPGFINAFSSPLYIGILPLWLAIFALWVNRSRAKIFWAALALGSLLIAFGFYVFAYAIFYHFVPGFALFRGQERLALVISFALALLAGYGWRELQSSFDVKRARRVWALLPAGIVISLMFVCALYISGTLKQSGQVAFLGTRAGLMTLLFVLTSVLVGKYVFAPRSSDSEKPGASGEGRMVIVLTIALIAFDLFSINTQAYNAPPRDHYPATSIIQTIKNDRGVFRVADEGKMPGHFGIMHNLEEIGGISPLKIARYDFLRDHLPAEKLWSLLNVRYAITERPGFHDAELVTHDGSTRLLRLNDPMPRAWFAPYAVHNANDDQVLAAMASDAFDPWNVAYIADASPFPIPSPDRRGAGGEVKRAAEFTRITPEHARVVVNAPADGLLVLSENYYYPGWRAVVDGAPAPILRANVALSAVPVRAGAGRVDFVFDPWSVKMGMVVTLVTFFIAIVGMLVVYCLPIQRVV